MHVMGVPDLLTFGCFVSSRFSRYHCNVMKNINQEEHRFAQNEGNRAHRCARGIILV